MFSAFSRLGNELGERRRARWFADRRERILKLRGSWLQNVNGSGATKDSPVNGTSAPVFWLMSDS